ncbi:hypothetical protein GII36_01230 [Candidatus Mycosynbacter amalyticus]|uniref:LGFP repeat-containing protein n=1 Tax=Candidatus Mycosynbacter amalyticus TaxID=2665156 RepID=A0A857MMG8_9BACT|nr:hypothetical protein [Candidatus Mycosynbacter amalyticus]QHN42469.1 hypothetical protein GII36_01230 [Candidatus Mycosynbacter amalyticus]
MNTSVLTTTKSKVPYAVMAVATVATLSVGILASTPSHALGGQSQVQAASAQYQNEIDKRYQSDAVFRQVLGAPIGGIQRDGEVYFQNYQNGRAYYAAGYGVHEVHGNIYTLFTQLGGHRVTGIPVTDEAATPDGKGKFNHFNKMANSPEAVSSIYWTAATGAHYVQNKIHVKWVATGWENGPLGYPITDEATAKDGVSKYNNFQQGTIYSSAQYGEKYVVGEIYKKWAQYNYDGGFLGKPMSDETKTPDGKGRFNVFEGGSVYWSPASGAHSIGGKIRDGWAAIGWEVSWLGYPTSDEYNIPGGKGQDFQGGYIRWTPQTGVVAYRK